MVENKSFEGVREKINLLEKENDKNKIKDLVIDIIVDLEKFCHRDDVQIHQVLVDARARCKEEINKPY